MKIKDYKRWMPKKSEINSRRERVAFKERDVFWVSIGENIGFEEDARALTSTAP
ncbi:MAG: hypothetical protein FWD27_02750 [Coriobacteriia bacterium]|nr:hypothetical protein [Coriobacteriia bacterium]